MICYWARKQDSEYLKSIIDDFKSDQSYVKHLQILSSEAKELNRQREYDYSGDIVKYTALEMIETLLKEGAMDPCEFSKVAID